MKKARRHFVVRTVPAGLALALGQQAIAQPARVDEATPAATALGYKHDASKVDAKKYPSFQTGRVCANCQLYQAKGNEPWAPCPALGGKLVNAKGWCTAWVKKA